MSLKQDLRDVVDHAVRHGWTQTRTRGGHLRLTPPDGGRVLFSPSTPSDYRGIRNLAAQLRRAGVPR